ncbi:putative integral membrane protein [Variovorax sp. SRS16]|uniref:RcnB family protein n=1 Tax=Variovorax sp. SRS16 TaxID=282217 RepID=UPI001316C4DD|nr:RcnB family protein [Variovorax sp. SRS16]VTU12806.1 putative integral membrane protein [Variovorax sp. SRS16]
MIKSKSMTVAAAVLAMCMAGSAFAQDRGFDRSPERNDRFSQRHDQRGHEDFRPGRQADRHGYPQPRAEWHRGDRVPTEYRGRNYVVNDWRSHRLQAPPRGYQWVGVGGDYVLAAIATGVIAQIIASQ